ncbi:dihydrofolate reductase [Nocardioides campestrisoli]|uniref:dihydrofolate reductase n=1 Tax=Nocardioides campestrisoli TaxID=2736757 RepID=UPI00163D60E2|nr:dihydrofolate reductase [Nocardioides campestrisoli]
MGDQRVEPDARVVVVAAYGRNRVIGDRGRIPWHLPDDFRHFKAETLGHTLVMGRATWDSIGRPLPGRTTVVLTRDRSWVPVGLTEEQRDRVRVVHSVDEALETARGLPGDTVIAGGGELYAQTLPVATHLVLTEVHDEPAGDAFFPEVDLSAWREVRRVSREDLDWVWWERR